MDHKVDVFLKKVSYDCNACFPNLSSTVSPGMLTKWISSEGKHFQPKGQIEPTDVTD